MFQAKVVDSNGIYICYYVPSMCTICWLWVKLCKVTGCLESMLTLYALVGTSHLSDVRHVSVALQRLVDFILW
jgi:hypothetical protein